MSVSKILNSLLKPLGCKVVKLEGEQQVHNFDPLERNDVETLEKLWGDPEFRAKYLSPTRQRLYEVVLAELQGLEVYGPACKLLDVGCGPGFFPRLIMDRGFEGQVFGCDFSEQAISLSSSLIPEGEFFKQDIYEPIKEKYDLIVCMETLEHLLHPDRAILNLADAAPTVVLTVPEGRKDSFRGHLNFWSKESFEVLLNSVLPNKTVRVMEVANEKNLLAKITEK